MGPGRPLDLRRQERAIPVFHMPPSGPHFGPFWGERWDPKAAPGDPLGRQRGSKTLFQEVKSRSRELQNDICMPIS